ncbi:hypothetical protein D9M72_511420 [compost metagenome]
MPAMIRTSAAETTGRTPKWFMNDAANGPSRPNRQRRIASASEIWAFDQPNSVSSGLISTPAEPIAPAVDSMTRKVTAATAQP